MCMLNQDAVGTLWCTQMLSSEPRKAQVLQKKVRWVQWDAQLQRLYVVYFRASHVPRSRSVSAEDLTAPILIGFVFDASGNYEQFV